jgi:putative phosphoribosyl transferase
MTRFRDRADAGRREAARLGALGLEDPVVLGLPRGGVPIAAEIAAALDVPFDVFAARKVGLPGQEELGIAAVAEGLPEPVLSPAGEALGASLADLDVLAGRARAELSRRADRYRGGRPLPDVAGRDVVVADDGLATGVTAEAALRALRLRDPRRLVLAVPVCPADTRARLAAVADDIVCVITRSDFTAVGEWYDDFAQLTDDDVLRLLKRG